MNSLIFFILNQTPARQTISNSSAVPIYKTIATTVGGTSSISSMIFRAIWSLIIVIAIMFFIIWLMRKFSSKNVLFGKNGNEKIINIIGKSSLNSKQAIYVVEVPERILILGVSGDNINILSEIKEPSIIKSIKESSKEGIFNQYLKGFTSNFLAKGVKNNLQNSEISDSTKSRSKKLSEKFRSPSNNTRQANDKKGSGLL